MAENRGYKITAQYERLRLSDEAGTADATQGTAVTPLALTNAMAGLEKAKLAAIDEGANAYELPTASATELGGVKVGDNLTIDADGVLSGNYSEATTTAAGLMSAADKTKLDGLVVAEDDEVTEMLDEVFA